MTVSPGHMPSPVSIDFLSNKEMHTKKDLQEIIKMILCILGGSAEVTPYNTLVSQMIPKSK